MSELPDERAGTPAEGAKEHAWTSVTEARASWSGAMRAHEQAPPDPGFRDRLRALADAAAAMRDAHARALQAGLAWRPIADSERARPPYELRPGTGRRGPTRALDPLRRRSAAAQPGRRGRQPGRRRRRLRRSSPGRLGVGRRATGRRRVTRPALTSGNGWRSEWSPARVPQARGGASRRRAGRPISIAGDLFS